MKKTSESPIVAYCNCMEDIKTRVSQIRRIVSGHSPLGNEGLDGEVVCLLLRKALEQVVFASLIANSSAYSAVHNDLSTAWRAKRLLDRLANVHPEFYPKPFAFSTFETGRVKHLLEVNNDYLTREEFVFLYDSCSEVMHTWNPFREDPRVVNFGRPIAEWIDRLQKLLQVHWVKLSGVKDIWLVQMHHPEDGKVHAFLSTQIEAIGGSLRR